MEIECMNFSQDDFIDKFNQQEEDILKYYQNLSFNEKSVEEVIGRPAHGHTGALADLMRDDMERFGISESQERNLKLLAEGRRVVIGGQQAGLFMSPAYIIHKIMSVIIVAKDVKEKYDYDAVPVFWIAGEDHDYEEINHTFVYDSMHRKRRKVTYKPNLRINMSIGFYEYDKKVMKETLHKIIELCGDREDLLVLRDKVESMIERHNYWTELFHALVHDVFKDEGVLIFNSHLPEVRALEKGMFRRMIESHGEIHEAFLRGQKNFTEALGIPPVIQTDTNVHLFTGSNISRSLLSNDGGHFTAGSEQYTKEELLELLETSPEVFSNNVVTRPLMQEMLFNTLIFLGGNAEVKYWGELHEVFKVMDVDMPIISKRMEFAYIPSRLEKMASKYRLPFGPGFHQQADDYINAVVEDDINPDFVNKIHEITGNAKKDYDELHDLNSQEFMTDIVEANFRHHLKQLDYLERRYRTEVKRQKRKELGDVKELQERLLPGGALHERIYHPWQYMTGISCFPPLSYTTDLVLVKTL